MSCIACVIVECFVAVVAKLTCGLDDFTGIAWTMLSTVHTAGVATHKVRFVITVWSFTVKTVVTGSHKSRERSDAVEMIVVVVEYDRMCV